MSPILWQRIEGAAIFAVALVIVSMGGSQIPLWLMLLLFFATDLSFAADLAGSRIGALGYNLVHNCGFGALVVLVGVATGPTFGDQILIVAGLLFAAHAGFDRMPGYGLKAPTGFKDTHLGRIGG